MSNFVKVLLNRVRPYTKYLTIIALIVIFSIAINYGYQHFYKNPQVNKPFQNVANMNPQSKTITIYFFHVDWCPHCNNAQPQWNGFMTQYNNKNVNGYNIVCLDQDLTDDTNPKNTALINQFNIESYPTIIAVKPDSTNNGKQINIRFEAKVNTKNLEKFVLSITDDYSDDGSTEKM